MIDSAYYQKLQMLAFHEIVQQAEAEETGNVKRIVNQSTGISKNFAGPQQTSFFWQRISKGKQSSDYYLNQA